ncbi:TonB-dependent receptor [Flavobacterium daejeonense]|uniref:hypothetical protein n=1 Tax=Flavobacterium daejeonense TaxID=350893 RepID=UPI00047B700F|nr:hypothetical protein [Flavobacterium daejeonense]
MKTNQQKIKSYLLGLMMLGNGAVVMAQEVSKNQEQKSDTTVVSKEVKNRNVMLSAESSSSPRQLNIGLPFAGDVLICENDVPIVYTFWTQMPMSTWRYDSSIGRIGLMSFADGALTFGKVGYMVTSFDRDPGRKFKGNASVYTSSFGSINYDVAITGPMGKKGWGYILAMNQVHDRVSGYHYGFTEWADRGEFYKAGISKRYKSGSFKLLYKQAADRAIFGAYAPLRYDGNGKTSELDNFKLGGDSYILGSGIFPYNDYNTGEAKFANLMSDKATKTISRTLYFTGEHKFANKMKLDYSTMFMKSKAAFTLQYPISLNIKEPDQQEASGDVFKYYDTDNVYNGSAQMVAAQYYPQTDITTSLTRLELTHKIKNHSLRGGFTYQYYNAPITSHGGIYYQTVEAQPKLLDWYMDLAAYGMPGVKTKVTQNGLLPSSGIGGYSRSKINKAALYFSDDIVFNKRFNGGFGIRLENENNNEIHDQYINQFVMDRPLVEDTKNHLNKVFTGNIVAKATNNFGFLADVVYNSSYSRYWDYNERDAEGFPVAGAVTSIPKDISLNVLNYGGGIYWNKGELFSIVSKVTHISKNNIVTSQTGYNAVGQTQIVAPIIYDISTTGWTTDIISNPFKNFNVHFLMTFQKPEYRNYSYSIFGTNYSYNNKTIPELSKFLLEFDPSYYMFKRDVRLWLSLRYFGPQAANPTNAFNYKGWIENFGGVDYHVNRSLDLKLQVVNFLGQSGVKGAIVGADQITDATPYIGRTVVAGGIRPRTIELTAKFSF